MLDETKVDEYHDSVEMSRIVFFSILLDIFNSCTSHRIPDVFGECFVDTRSQYKNDALPTCIISWFYYRSNHILSPPRRASWKHTCY